MSNEENNTPVVTPELAQQAAFEVTGVLWKCSEELALAKLREQGYKMLFDSNSGEVNCTDAEGSQIRLSDALRNLATSEEGTSLADQRSVRFLSKEDFPDRESKTSFIAANGILAWAAIPLKRRPVVTGVVTTQEQWAVLSTRQKSDLLSEKGLAWLQSLPKADSQEEQDKRAGIKRYNPKK
jgi:hypothetical protein